MLTLTSATMTLSLLNLASSSSLMSTSLLRGVLSPAAAAEASSLPPSVPFTTLGSSLMLPSAIGLSWCWEEEEGGVETRVLVPSHDVELSSV